MDELTEIIPEDMPAWAKDAMDRGQFFNEACKRVEPKLLSDALVKVAGMALTIRLFELRISTLMEDIDHGDMDIFSINDRLINMLRDAN